MVLLFAVVLVVLIRGGSIKPGPALVAVLFGFFLASTGMAPSINRFMNSIYQFAQAVVEGGQVPMLVGEVARGKALAVVVEAAKVVDTNGEVVDLEDDEEETTEAAAEATTEEKAADKAEEINEASASP
ncbi:hypothetical protein SMICM17S_11763 [Streptomyces microflavus]